MDSMTVMGVMLLVAFGFRGYLIATGRWNR